MGIARQDFRILMNQGYFEKVIEMMKVVLRANLIEVLVLLSSTLLVHPVELPSTSNHHKHLDE
jgi:hypothetical protein